MKIRMRNLFNQNVLVGGLLLTGASFLFNGANYLFVLIMGRRLSVEEFGTLTLLSSFFFLIGIPVSGITTTTQRYIAYFASNKSKRSWIYRFTRNLTVSLAVAGVLIYGLVLSPLQAFFHLDSAVALIWFTPVVFLSFIYNWLKSVLQGERRFRSLSVIVIFEGISKLAAAFVSVWFGWGLLGAIWAFWASIALSSGLAWWFVKKRSRFSEKVSSYPKLKNDVKVFFKNALMASFGLMVLLSIDILILKHVADPELAGQYALLTLFGKIVLLGVGALGSVILPTISKNLNKKWQLARTVTTGYLLIVSYVVAVVASYGVFGEFLSELLVGQRAGLVIPYLADYGFSVGLLALGLFAVQVQLLKKRYIFAWVPLVFAVLLSGVLWFRHDSIGTVIQGYQLSSGLFFLGVIGLTVADEVADFVRGLGGLLKMPALPKPVKKNGLSILILNWRDTKHEWSGGAEVYVHELAKRWVREGHAVCLFAGNDRKNKDFEKVEGVSVVRKGGFVGVYFWAMVYYFFGLRKQVDVIVDCENGVPFFAPVYANKPVVLLIHHVHQEVFRENLPKPFSWIAVFLESKIMPLVYRYKKVVTASGSSKREIQNLAIFDGTPSIVHPGIDVNVYKPGQKAGKPLVTYVGRLEPYKSLAILLVAFKKVLEHVPKARLVVAGEGSERKKLEKNVKELGIGKKVKFLGKVSEQKKIRLYQQSWVNVNPSFMEGWGITSIESNACGTVMAASDVAGLQDSVVHNKTGLLFRFGDSLELAGHLAHLLTSNRERRRMEKQALVWSRKFSWDKSSRQFLRLIKITVNKSRSKTSRDSFGLDLGELVEKLPEPLEVVRRLAYVTSGRNSERKLNE